MLFKPFQAISLLAVTCAANWAPRPTSAPGHSTPDYIQYSTVTGFFLQDDNATVPGTFDYVRYFLHAKKGGGGANPHDRRPQILD
jgi:hypothetical protein